MNFTEIKALISAKKELKLKESLLLTLHEEKY